MTIEYTDARGRVIVLTARFKYASDASREAEQTTCDLINAGQLTQKKPMPVHRPSSVRPAVVLP